MILVTGGAGFIGSNFIHQWLAFEKESIINLDKLTYSGNLNNLSSINFDPRHHFKKGDIADRDLVRTILLKHKPRAIIHFAAETHVDRSITAPDPFIQTNVVGTCTLLEETLAYWKALPPKEKAQFRFLHVSTDEVFGALGIHDAPFDENCSYSPNSPYSASKAAADHFVRAYHKTYEFPTLITNCSNNYGPFQFPEKLIPLMTLHAIQKKSMPLYGDGLQERNWLHVTDHCSALRLVLSKGMVGDTYLIGDQGSKSNLEIVNAICSIMDEWYPHPGLKTHRALIKSVPDRPGHDKRYDINSGKIRRELGWRPSVNFVEGIRKTVEWYIQNEDWVSRTLRGDYQDWIHTQYASVKN